MCQFFIDAGCPCDFVYNGEMCDKLAVEWYYGEEAGVDYFVFRCGVHQIFRWCTYCGRDIQPRDIEGRRMYVCEWCRKLGLGRRIGR